MRTNIPATYTATTITPADYQARIDDLRQAATEEDIQWNEASSQDFLTFVAENPEWRRGDIVLMNNGNLRTVWDADNEIVEGPMVALQFKGDGCIQYVIFTKPTGSSKVHPEAGTETLETIKPRLSSLGMDYLVHASSE